MGHVLVDDPESIFIYGENKRIANLPQRTQRRQRSQRGLLFPRVDFWRAPMVWNRFGEPRFEPARHRNRRVGLDSDSVLKLKPRRNRRRESRLQSEAARSGFIECLWWRRRCIQVRRRIPVSRSGRKARTRSRMRTHLRSELRRRTRLHQSGARRIAHKVVHHTRLPKAHFRLRGMDINIHFPRRHFKKQQHHRKNRRRNDVAISLGQPMLNEPIANQSPVDEDVN